ncbi:formyltetrahydrofolate deformylase [Variovorax sp. 770b2]|uniref:formyltetrahydrofolate deformylase n=1 Tax=Variovorax sp. 770b2 TaxID=1566271 RepID=UPI0008E81B78|nr:formyltetrahydrofolate deformylase [Variovorax sp. 770b2]SFP60957.1 formyltetrahydrofolate deformylase [Variovorax sp. 770b2]
MSETTPRRYILTLTCPDRTGIVAAVGSFIASHGGLISQAAQHGDALHNRFYMRVEIQADTLPFYLDEFRERFAPLARQFEMEWGISDSSVKKRMVVLVSKLDHCLNDLLHRWRNKDLHCEIPCVVSNHNDLRSFVEWHGIPYFHVPVTPETKEQAYAEVERLFREFSGDFMVLARYMQVLSDGMTERLRNRIINIHHSFLPAFVGGKPYHQAFERGVKMTGATSHYVTAELDAGPIIEQGVIDIDHGNSIEEMVRLGKDIEKSVLSRSVRHHLEDRILVHRNKTVVFK